jgi:hypothetical protein
MMEHETFEVLVPKEVKDAFQYVSGYASADIECTVQGNVATVTAPVGTFICPTAIKI